VWYFAPKSGCFSFLKGKEEENWSREELWQQLKRFIHKSIL
jgi:hypothetical protein